MKPQPQQILNADLPLLECKDVCGMTPNGRILFEGLNMNLLNEKVALIGRNGVGKSTLLEIFCGNQLPDKGKVFRNSDQIYVPQQIITSEINQEVSRTLQCIVDTNCTSEKLKVEFSKAGLKPIHQIMQNDFLSQGELRKLKLLMAKISHSKLLILDEPTQDLDEHGITWLLSWLNKWPGGVLVASHEIQLLKEFQCFFILAETGCESFVGTFGALTQKQETEFKAEQIRYAKNLNQLIAQEELTHRIARRRLRKKQFGRVSEMGRATPKATLNQKRDYAQVKHGRMKKSRDAKLNSLRQWSLLTRRKLKVELPGILPIRESSSPAFPIITLKNVSVNINGQLLFEEINHVQLGQRIAVVGPNGSGKTTLLHTMLGLRSPTKGQVKTNLSLVGSILQGGGNWMLNESLLSYLTRNTETSTIEELSNILIINKFPLALAERPLSSLSPGERVRAALICLFQKKPHVELLVLDEPTYSLDLIGLKALTDVLKIWAGGLIIASHAHSFLEAIGMEDYIKLG